jgi:hypothetical protein
MRMMTMMIVVIMNNLAHPREASGLVANHAQKKTASDDFIPPRRLPRPSEGQNPAIESHPAIESLKKRR